jgi:hypothetical protein
LNRLARLRPAPATVISLVALFVSLGGVSYGVATGYIDSREIKNNTVRSADLRNNQVRTLDLRNNEVRGLDIRNSTIQGRDVGVSTLTGTDIRESTLAEVPLAERAERAAAADSVSSLDPIPFTAVGAGGSATLATHGSLTLSGACVSGMGGPTAELRVASTESGSAADGAGASVPVLGPGDGPQPVATLAAGAPRAVDSSEVVAWTPSGKALSGVVSLTADAGSCRFQGHAVLSG